MSNESEIAEISIRLFAFYKRIDTNLEDVKSENIFPTFTYVKKGKEKQEVSSELPFFEESNQVSETTSGLNMLHPEAKRFLSSSGKNSVKTYVLNDKLLDEVWRSEWKTVAPNWVTEKQKELPETFLTKEEGHHCFTFKIRHIGASYFPTGITAIYIDIAPNFKLTDITAPLAGKMMINKFNQAYPVMKRSGKSRDNVFWRVFKKEHKEKQVKSVKDRFGKNADSGLIKGLCGDETTLNEIVFSLLGKEYSFLMGDRFISSTFLKTKWEGTEQPFDESNYVDLVRLSRGESDNYIPYSDDCKPGRSGIINTFENVIFSLSGEGIACWVKPHLNQTFLINQFKQKFDTIYLQLVLLALHQRYALVDLAQQLSNIVPPRVNSDSIATLEERSDSLRRLRNEVANFYLRAYFRQPAVLDNHQAFYQKLQNVLGITDLLNEVQKSTEELDFLISSTHARCLDEKNKEDINRQNEQSLKLLEKIGELIEKQENTEKIGLVLSLIVEITALPYYTYGFAKACLGEESKATALIIAGSLAVFAVGCTILQFIRTRSKNKNK